MRLTGTRDKRLDLRISEIDKNFLETAVSYTGDTISAFVLKNALRSAQEIISSHQNEISLNKKDQLLFFNLIVNSPSPNNYLIQSSKEYITDQEDSTDQNTDA